MNFLFCLFLFSFPILSFSEEFKVTFLKGTISIMRDGKSASPPVKTGDKVTVSRGGIVILKSSDTTLKLSGSTIIEPMSEKERSVINLIQGSIVSRIKKKAFEVKTKGAVFGVRGTEFFVSTLNGDESWMCVHEGIVSAIVKDKSVDVSAGLGVFVGKNEISTPEAFKWTKGINWELEATKDLKDHNVKLNYNLIDQFYD